MFITLNKEMKINKQCSFEELLLNETPNYIINRQYTFETNTPKNWTAYTQHCADLLKSLTTRHPEIQALSREDITKLYTTKKIPKKSGGLRTINAPCDSLKHIQRNIVTTLKQIALTHNSAYAYVEKRSIYNALEQHKNNSSKWFLKIDLKDFFGSCTEEFIYSQLKQIYPFALLTSDETYDNIIKDIIKIACLNGVLPQGNPISPHLTNLLMIPIDYKLNKLTPVYTRYSDDMLFSAQSKIDMDLTLKNINKILEDTPLRINPEKTRLGSINGRNWNLGLMLNNNNDITLGHEKKRRFKATIDQYLYNPENYTPQQTQQLAGLTAYYLHIEPGYIKYIINKYNKKHNKDLLYLLHHPF
jgi:hypothetical protein